MGQATRPEREVTLFAANAVQADIDRLERERAVLIEQAEASAASWGDPGDREADTAAIDKELAAARAKLAASGLAFRVRSLDSDDEDAILRRIPMPKDPTNEQFGEVTEARAIAFIAAQVFEPKVFTVDELKALRKGLGEAEFMKLARACEETRTSASSPFWRGSSGSSRNS